MGKRNEICVKRIEAPRFLREKKELRFESWKLRSRSPAALSINPSCGFAEALFQGAAC